jgi:tyrosine-protein kinase Etk/Wzc
MPPAAIDAGPAPSADPGAAPPGLGLPQVLTWVGESKRRIAAWTLVATIAALALAFSLPPIYTGRTTLLPPGSQQQGSSSAALAALGAAGGLVGGLTAKTPDELYVALLRSNSVQRALIDRFDLRKRTGIDSYESMFAALQGFVRVAADKKSGLITVEVDDRDPAFAAALANGYANEVTHLLARLAISEAQLRRAFFERQLKETKEHLVQAEEELRRVQETSGVIVLDKQAEALIGGAAQLRAQIEEREVALAVLRKSATAQNPDMQRLGAELAALRSALARMESNKAAEGAGVTDMPVGKIPAAAIDYVRARRELRLQEALLEGMIRQYEIAKLDEAKEGPVLQQVDVAMPPDRKSKPARSVVAASGLLIGLLLSSAWAVWRGHARQARGRDPLGSGAWDDAARAWRWRR